MPVFQHTSARPSPQSLAYRCAQARGVCVAALLVLSRERANTRAKRVAAACTFGGLAYFTSGNSIGLPLALYARSISDTLCHTSLHTAGDYHRSPRRAS